MIYLDTNIIVYAIENHSRYGKTCKAILEDIESGKLKASSSILVLVELTNVIVKLNRLLEVERKRQLDLKENIEAVLSLPITWIDLDFLVIEKASEYAYQINGVDYVHLASMEIYSIREILSADKDLDRVESVRRVDPLKY